ncbi:MAG: hypothetical protein ACLTDI_12670 [Acutalibacteraceae bacterium]
MLIVTHEMKFARDVSSRIFYMDQENYMRTVLGTDFRPSKERTRAFVKGARSLLNKEITSRRFDYIEISTAIEEFGRRQILSQRHINNIELIFGGTVCPDTAGAYGG